MIPDMAPRPGPVFYPKYLDISPEEGILLLRQLELEAYAGIISALRSQGDLSKEKKTLLTEICACLGISEDRHRAEVRRAVNDEKLATIALHNSGHHSDIEWKKEGRRIVPLPRRPLEITAYMEEADRVAEMIAKENANLPVPTQVKWENFTKSDHKTASPPEEPAELAVRKSTVMNSSIYCAKCLSKQNETMDASTSMEDWMETDSPENQEFGSNNVPSASDSCVYLPSGTTVHVSMGNTEKEEPDAYSLKPNQAGNFDFGNAPEISLGGRGSKRKRKKSVGVAPAAKEGSLTIQQIVRPNSNSLEELSSGAENNSKLPVVPDFQRKKDVEKQNRPTIKPETKRRHAADDQPRPPTNEHTSRSKRKKPVSQAVTIQHTPVPPEHLYAVGANKKPKQRKMASAPPEDEDPYVPHSRPPPEYTVVSTEHSPTKHLGLYSSRISPLSPSYYPGLASSWPAGTMPREPAASEPTASFSKGFHYSPTKPFYRPPGIGQNAYGRSSKPPPSKRHRSSPSSFTFSKKASPGDAEHHGILQKIPGKKDSPHGGEMQQNKVYTGRQSFPGQTGQYTGPIFHPSQTGATFTIPTTDPKREQEHPPQPLSHSSSLEELASVSLMASALSTSSIVETGLAPVSAIMSRVASPAPGQATSAPSVKKTAPRPMMVSRIQSEEGPSVQLPRVGHTITTQASAAFIPARHGSVALGTNPNVSKIKMQGSFSSVSGQHPVTHQVRLAVSSSDNGTISSVPINFTSALPLPTISSPSSQGPRVISSISGKPHTLLKPSAPNVITVTAKPLPGGKTSGSTIVSGASIVKPQIGQKTSIIVLHKAAGAKGKTMQTAFPTLGGEGSKVITVSTKNLASSDLPRFSAESQEENAPESALGSIQGLVSGLNPMVRKAKVITKPKFLTMPIKKPIAGKVGDTTKAKIIQNVIRAPAKVLVKASGSTITPGQLRTIPTGQVVKPVTPAAVLDSSSGGPDIVAAALSQSIGASVVTSTPEVNPASSPDGAPTANIIKVATSTPAASTIKAFAATYQKNSSASQIKQSFAGQSSVTTMSPSLPDKAKVFLATSPSQPKTQPMLFTPNQPQVHRSPQSTPAPKPKPTFPATVKSSLFPGSTAPFLASVGSLPKANIKAVPSKAAYQQTSQQSIMHVKVIGQPSTNPHHQGPIPWQPVSTMSKAIVQDKGLDETATQTKILQDIMDSSSSPQSVPSVPQSLPTTSDRATFIYQYHPTPRSDQSPGVRAPVVPISTMDSGDVITLHSIGPDAALARERPDISKTVSAPKTNLVKINLSSIQSASSIADPTKELSSTTVGDAFNQHIRETVESMAVEVKPQMSEAKHDLVWADTRFQTSSEPHVKGHSDERNDGI